MTEDESALLREIRNALLKPEPGKDVPLLHRLARMEAEWSRMKWGWRMLLVAFVGIGTLVATWDKIKAFAAGLVK